MSVDDMIFAIKNMELYKLKVSDYIDFMMMWYRDILMPVSYTHLYRI